MYKDVSLLSSEMSGTDLITETVVVTKIKELQYLTIFNWTDTGAASSNYLMQNLEGSSAFSEKIPAYHYHGIFSDYYLDLNENISVLYSCPVEISESSADRLFHVFGYFEGTKVIDSILHPFDRDEKSVLPDFTLQVNFSNEARQSMVVSSLQMLRCYSINEDHSLELRYKLHLPIHQKIGEVIPGLEAQSMDAFRLNYHLKQSLNLETFSSTNYIIYNIEPLDETDQCRLRLYKLSY